MPDHPAGKSLPSEQEQRIVPLSECIESLCDCGLLTRQEVQAFLDGLPPDKRPTDGKQLAEELYRQKKLTRFQAQTLYQGRTRALVIGNYVVLDRLGAGGMGQVYKARHRRLDRVVAIKLLPAAATKSEDAVKRFQREAKAAARLSHPNIVKAYDADEYHGVHFLVMECVEGRDLAKLVKDSGPVAVATVVDYLRQAARGLAYAHGQGVIHRDIKPANLLLDQRGTVKVLDLGLARLDQPLARDHSLTRSGQVMGTLDYMAPEQAYDTRHAAAPADIYSLGCTLCYLLTGRPPFGGQTLAQKILAHREQPIPSLRAARPDVPAWLDAVFQKMLAKDVGDRYHTMDEVLIALSEQSAPQIAPPPVPPAVGAALLETQSLHELDAGTSPEQEGAGVRGGSPLELPIGDPQRENRLLRLWAAWVRSHRRVAVLGAAGLVLTASLLVALLSLRTKPGTLVVELPEPGVSVLILDDRGQVLTKRVADKKTVALAVNPGPWRLCVQKQGETMFSQDVMIVAGDRQTIRAHWDEKIVHSDQAQPQVPEPESVRDAPPVARSTAPVEPVPPPSTTPSVKPVVPVIPRLPKRDDPRVLPPIHVEAVGAVAAVAVRRNRPDDAWLDVSESRRTLSPSYRARYLRGLQPNAEAAEGRITARSFVVVAVKALVPYEKQVEEYERALSERQDFLPQRDVPRYLGFVAERAEIPRQPNAALQWTPIGTSSDMRNKASSFAYVPAEIADETYLLPVILTMPVPPILLRPYAWAALHSEIPSQPPKPVSTTVTAVENNTAQIPADDEQGTRMDPSRVAVDEAVNAAIPLTKYKLVRFFDLTAEVGKAYRYRVQLLLQDPNRPQDPGSEPRLQSLQREVVQRLLQVEAADQEHQRITGKPRRTSWVQTAWSESSNIVRVESPERVVAGSVTAPRVVSLGVAGEGPKVQTTEVSGKLVPVVWDQRRAVEVPAEREVFLGSWLNFTESAEVLHPLTLQTKILQGYAILTDAFVADIRGGEELSKDKQQVLSAPGEFLLVTKTGRLVVCNEIDDTEEYRRLLFVEDPH